MNLRHQLEELKSEILPFMAGAFAQGLGHAGMREPQVGMIMHGLMSSGYFEKLFDEGVDISTETNEEDTDD
jgi:hypothetical protein